MRTETSIAVTQPSGHVTLNTELQRVVAIAEVTFAFCLVHVVYRALKTFTILGQWDAQTNFVPGLTMVVFTMAILLLSGRSFAAYGLGTERWSYHLKLGVTCSLILAVVAAVGVLVTKVHIDAGKPPDPHGPFQFLRLAGLANVALPAFAAVLWLAWRRRPLVERIPTAAAIAALFALLAVLPAVAAYAHRPAMWATALWLLFGAGFGEEIFFRGYIQSRVDEAFAHPFHFLGMEFGAGLVVAALFFALIHALNTVDYYHGKFDFGWWYGLQNLLTGLFFGLLRSRTGNVLPGAIVHGLQDVFARIPSVLP
jgi:membrane protease YdiL (CAAX protease family)